MYVCMYIVVGAVNIVTVPSTSLPYYSGSVELAMWLLQNANRFDVVYSASPRWFNYGLIKQQLLAACQLENSIFNSCCHGDFLNVSPRPSVVVNTVIDCGWMVRRWSRFITVIIWSISQFVMTQISVCCSVKCAILAADGGMQYYGR